MQPVQLSLIPDPGPASSTGRSWHRRRRRRSSSCPPMRSATAITLLANVIAKAAAARGSGVVGDE